MPRLTSAALVTCTAAFVAGLALALLGGLKPRLAKRLGVGEAQVGGLVAALYLTLIPMMLLSGILIDALGVRLVLVVGSLVLALAVFGLALRATFPSAVVSVLTAGAGLSAVSVASVALMPAAFGFGPRDVAASVNLGHVFFALGALLAPALADQLLRAVDFRRGVGLLALACLLPAAASFGVPAGGLDSGGPRADLAEVLGDVYLLMLGIACLLYGPLEFGLSAWGTTYLTADLGYDGRRAARTLTLFWLAFLASRVLVTACVSLGWLRPAWMPALVFVLALASAGVLGNLAGAAHASRAGAMLIVLGALLGPVFPTLVALALRAFPENRGAAYGALFAVGTAGGLLMMPLLGVVVRGRRVTQALRLLAPLALLLVVAALAIALK